MERRIPDLSRISSTSLQLENIELNGQKLMFDKKVRLMPVAIEEKQNADE